MNNKSDNLDGFIKNKLNNLSGLSDGWDVPDGSVWEQAVAGMSSVDQPIAFYKMPFVKIAAFVIGLSIIGGYIFVLNQKINKTEIINKKQQAKIDQLNNQVLLSKKENSELISVNEYLKKENKLIEKEKEDLEKKSFEQQYAINYLTIENQEKQKGKIENNFLEIEKIVEKDLPNLMNSINRNIETPDLLNLKDLVILIPVTRNSIRLPLNDFSKKTIPIKKKQKEIEVGYEYGFSKIIMPSLYDFKDFKAVDKGLKEEVFNVQYYGLNVAFSPMQNLFIKAGVRKSAFEMFQNTKIGLYYDETKEYEKPDGTIGVGLPLAMNTPYAEQESTIAVDVPDDWAVEKDVLFVGLEEYQQVESYQIPLGLQYYFGNNKLNWFLEGGLQWNKMKFSDYKLQVEIGDAKGEEWEVDKVDYVSKPVFSKQFVTAYGGAGVNFQILNNWYLRGAYNYHFNFEKNKSKDFSNTELNSTSFNLGLNYRF